MVVNIFVFQDNIQQQSYWMCEVPVFSPMANDGPWSPHLERERDVQKTGSWEDALAGTHTLQASSLNAP